MTAGKKDTVVNKKDILEQSINEYYNGVITLEDLERRLTFDQWQVDKYNNRRHIPITEYAQYSLEEDDPLSIIIRQESLQDMKKLIPILQDKLKTMDWYILSNILDGKSYADIAGELDWKVTRVRKRYQRIKLKARKIFIEMRNKKHESHHH